MSLPVVVLVEIVAAGSERAQLVVAREVCRLIAHRRPSARGVRARRGLFGGVQLSNAEDERLVSSSLAIVDEVHMGGGVRVWTQQCPVGELLVRGVEERRAIERIDEQKSDAAHEWPHLDVHGDGQRTGDVHEVQAEQLSVWCAVVVGGGDILSSHGRDGRCWITRNDELDGLVGRGVDGDGPTTSIQQGERHAP